MRRKQLLLLSLILLCLSTYNVGPLWAATINAASCSQANVNSAITSAVDGDTVIIPAGTCSWTTTLTITKGISLLGAGAGSTVLQDNVPKGDSNCQGGGPLMDWTVNMANRPNTLRISGFTIQGVATDPAVCQKGHV